MRRAILLKNEFAWFCVALFAGWWPSTYGAVVQLAPSQDNSIFSESDASNGAGPLFSGVTAQGNLRRALLQFDIASNVPAGATITAVTLGLTQIKIGPGAVATFELHPLSAAWGEGTANGLGAGTTAGNGDATWNFRHYNTNPWSAAGGDFGAISGTATLGIENQLYTFASQPAMVADVQNWRNAPASNFGWILREAAESPSATTAREFGSRESGGSFAPTLTITYSVPEPGVLSWVAVGLVGCVLRGHRRRMITGNSHGAATPGSELCATPRIDRATEIARSMSR